MRWDRKQLRRAERLERKELDPYFGKRRKTSMEGDRRKAASKKACRKGNYDR